MIRKFNKNIVYYQSEKLLTQNRIQHFFSTREGGFDELETVSDIFDIPLSKIIVPVQTHSNNIAIITSDNLNLKHTDTDALITSEEGIFIAVKTADCTPVLLFDPIEEVVAAIHSGWRGTVQNITGKTIATLTGHFRSKPENILAAIGPCIGQSNYEVGPEVIALFQKQFSNTSTILNFNDCANGKAKLNLRTAIYFQLLKACILPANIENTDICTFDNCEDFYSARREGSETGRMINGIQLKKTNR